MMIEIRIKPDAKPIDNITKFAWDDDDYIKVETPDEPKPANPTPGLQEQLNMLSKAVLKIMRIINGGAKDV